MNHIVSFSSGLSSAVTASLVLERYPDAYVVFMDTLAEDEDNYRFLNDWCEVFEPKNFIRLCDGRTPLQVFEDRKIIPNQKIAPCTFELKLKPFYNWLLTLSGESTIYKGIISQRVLSKLDFQSPCVSCGVGMVQASMFGERM